MLDKRRYNDNILYHDMPLEDQHEWFGYSRNKFALEDLNSLPFT